MHFCLQFIFFVTFRLLVSWEGSDESRADGSKTLQTIPHAVFPIIPVTTVSFHPIAIFICMNHNHSSLLSERMQRIKRTTNKENKRHLPTRNDRYSNG